MKISFSGSVHFANGDPISNVVVRIFDKDASGKEDDDLTAIPGLSDDQGNFHLSYEPLRYLDYHTAHLSSSNELSARSQADKRGLLMPDLGDLYLPYLKFNFTINGVAQEYTASLGLLQTVFQLPLNPAVNFLPSRDSFKFPNRFSGYFLPYSMPAFLSSRKISSKYGLCGGMCAAVYDFLLAGRAIPQVVEVPKQGTRLQRYLFRRQMDSLGGLGQQAIKVAQWTVLPSDTMIGTMRRTADEFNQLRVKLDQGNLVILALIYEHATTFKELSRRIFNNHQVLAWAYQEDAQNVITIQIYDPNLPGHDDVALRSAPVMLGEEESPAGADPVIGLESTEVVGGESYREVRGYFEMPYSPVHPSKGL
jgi:hypothetical protein